jgi:hypothetical protein
MWTKDEENAKSQIFSAYRHTGSVGPRGLKKALSPERDGCQNLSSVVKDLIAPAVCQQKTSKKG